MAVGRADFLRGFFPDLKGLEEQPLLGDGGHRTYTRLKFQGKTCILMFSGENDPSLKKFVRIQKRLRAAGLPVPQLLCKDFAKGLLLMEDLGDESLESIRLKSPGRCAWRAANSPAPPSENSQLKSRPRAAGFYFQALKRLAKMQEAVKTLPEDETFNRSFFMAETDLALSRLERLLRGRARARAQSSQKLFKGEMENIASRLEKTFYVFCHRDYHSRNIMIKNGKICLLDFQDGGRGPMVYDLASLLYDSYAVLEESERRGLLKFYFESLPAGLKSRFDSLSDLTFLAKLQFLQRGFKACGCFAGFYSDSKKGAHLRYIQPTLELLARMARNMGFPAISSYAGRTAASLDISSFLPRPDGGK